MITNLFVKAQSWDRKTNGLNVLSVSLSSLCEVHTVNYALHSLQMHLCEVQGEKRLSAASHYNEIIIASIGDSDLISLDSKLWNCSILLFASQFLHEVQNVLHSKRPLLVEGVTSRGQMKEAHFLRINWKLSNGKVSLNRICIPNFIRIRLDRSFFWRRR